MEINEKRMVLDDDGDQVQLTNAAEHNKNYSPVVAQNQADDVSSEQEDDQNLNQTKENERATPSKTPTNFNELV